MREKFTTSFEGKEKLEPNTTLLLAEPVIKHPLKSDVFNFFQVPLGSENSVYEIAKMHLTQEKLGKILAEE